jgi:TPR repeat protein
MIAGGRGVAAPDERMATTLFKQGCDRGSASSCYNLSRMYRRRAAPPGGAADGVLPNESTTARTVR